MQGEGRTEGRKKGVFLENIDSSSLFIKGGKCFIVPIMQRENAIYIDYVTSACFITAIQNQ
jgi:hypothetical protein